VCVGCKRALERGETQWRIPVVHATTITARNPWIGETWRHYEREDTFCAACAPPHVKSFESQRWVQPPPDGGEAREAFRLSYVYYKCRRCEKQWMPASETHPLRVAGSEGVPCCERCRKAIYRRARNTAATERLCDVCGERFTPKRSDARYCSNACRQDAYRKRKLGAA
jgi:hypothetical protein